MNLKHFAIAGTLVSAVALAAAPAALAWNMPGHMFMSQPAMNFMRRVHKTNPLAAWFQGNITAINGTSLTVNRNGSSISVDASNAKFIRRFGAVSSLSEFSVGDMVVIKGTWTDMTKTAVIATQVRDASIQKRNDVFGGTVTAISSTGFTVATHARGTQTVTVSSTTQFTGRRKAAMSFSDVKVGDKVVVRGLWDRTSSTITEVDSVRDTSFPAITPVTTTSTQS